MHDKVRAGVFFVYFDYDESKRNNVWFMCKLMNELFKIEIGFILKKVMNLKTLGVTYRPEIHGATYTLSYADLMDCMHFGPKGISMELFHLMCVAFGSDLTLD